MAKQMGLRLAQVTCIASSLKLGDGYSKTALTPLKSTLEQMVKNYQARVA
jgi:hypothetical protein